MKNPIKKPALFDRIRTAVRALSGDLVLEVTDGRGFTVSTHQIVPVSAYVTYPVGWLDLPKEAREIMARHDLAHKITDELLKSGALKISRPNWVREHQNYVCFAELRVALPENQEG